MQIIFILNFLRKKFCDYVHFCLYINVIACREILFSFHVFKQSRIYLRNYFHKYDIHAMYSLGLNQLLKHRCLTPSEILYLPLSRPKTTNVHESSVILRAQSDIVYTRMWFRCLCMPGQLNWITCHCIILFIPFANVRLSLKINCTLVLRGEVSSLAVLD